MFFCRDLRLMWCVGLASLGFQATDAGDRAMHWHGCLAGKVGLGRRLARLRRSVAARLGICDDLRRGSGINCARRKLDAQLARGAQDADLIQSQETPISLHGRNAVVSVCGVSHA